VRVLIFLLVMVATVMAGVKQYGPETWFQQDPAPVPIIAESIGNPLDYAAARIGLDARNVELPRGWEGGYRYCCRFPIIDYVSNRPLYMKQWAEDQSKALTDKHRSSGVLACECGLDVLDGSPPLQYRTWWMPAAEDTSIPAGVVRGLSGHGYSLKFEDEVVRLCRTMTNVWRTALEARGGLHTGDSAFFADNPGYYLAPDGKRMADITGNTDGQLAFIERARRVQTYRFSACARDLAAAVERYTAATAGWGASDFFADTAMAHAVVAFDAPFGRVSISGYGDDRHAENVALLIDLGGNDIYTNNAGGCRRSGGIALCIDHAGDDKYLAPDSNYVQGFGFLGVGMLVDLAGNDVYKAKHFSQGAGIMGVGVLWDKAGNDTFSANAFCQGAGMFGLGMMLDDSGNDVYDCATNGQGSATTLGLGILSDLEGNDQYRLACDTTLDALGGLAGYGQGGALSFRAYPWEKKLVAYGGVGMLVDDKGNDTYTSKGWNCQGGSYIMSLGVLVDNEGNDHYVCGTGQGSGIHVTNAILIDKKGDDVYEGGFRAGGSGSDRSPGFLIDYEGNDTYKSATSSYGTACKPSAYSLFIDYKGDDKYICDKPTGPVLMNDWHSFGGVWPESDPNAWPYAISLDLGGNDDYQVRNRANNSETHSFGHGIHLDMEWNGGDVIGKVEQPLEPVPESFDDVTDVPPYIHALEGIQTHSTFHRFGSVGTIVAAGSEALPSVVSQLTTGTNRELNRDLMECLHYWFVQSKIGDRELPEVLRLLKAQDPEVRTVIADDLGLWKMRGAEDALIEVAETDSSAQVRRFALRSLIRLESAKALPLAWRLAGNDTSEDVRRMAVNLIGKVRPSGEVLPLLVGALENDKASSVRCAAADAIGNIGEPAGIEPLRRAARRDMTETSDVSDRVPSGKTGDSPSESHRALRRDSPRFAPVFTDVYLQRACGKALCALYQVEGIDLLIKSMSFPSIDAFYNYDRNVPNYVSTFAGFDLPDSERYVQAKWQAWFDTHRDSINTKLNADAYKAWTSLSDSLRDVPDTSQVARYEAFLARFPGYKRAKAELAGKLNGIAWNLATGPKGSKGSNPKLALKYALRAVELSDDANIWDTVIEAYLVNGKKAEALRVCQEALAKHPNEQMLKDRRAQLERE
jgi:hypothetical protein